VNADITTNPAYRKVVAALDDCEQRYGALVKSMGDTDHSRLSAAVEALKKEAEARKRLENELLSAIESERQRIGQDLHDDLCQRLGAAALLIGSLTKEIVKLDPVLGGRVGEVPDVITEAIATCRNLARGLHPVTLASAGLPSALQELADRVPADVKFTWPRKERIDFHPETAVHIYRIAEEAVGNAVKHAKAKTISIGLAILDGHAILEIGDDGKGMGKKVKTQGMGLRNMNYRANVIGGKLSIAPREGGGTCVRCTLPFPGSVR
jgi:signal transduction histidine kinase